MLDSPLRQGVVLFGVLLVVLTLLEFFSVTNMGYPWALAFTAVFAGVWTVLNIVVKRRGD